MLCCDDIKFALDTMLSLLDGIYLLSPCSPTNTSHSEYQFCTHILPWSFGSGHASVSFGYGQERSSRSPSLPTEFTDRRGHCGSSTTIKDLVRRIYTDWLLRPVRLIAQLLRVCSRVARFIYWLRTRNAVLHHHSSIISFYLYTLRFPCYILLKVLFSFSLF